MEVAAFSSLCQGFFLLHCSAASFVVSTIEICRACLSLSLSTPLLLRLCHCSEISFTASNIVCIVATDIRHVGCCFVACPTAQCGSAKQASTQRKTFIYIYYIYICIYSRSLLFKFQLYLRSTISHKAAVAAANNKSCQLHKKLAKMPPKGCGCTLTKFVAFLCNLLSS